MKTRNLSIASSLLCGLFAVALAAAPAGAQLSPDKQTLSENYTAKAYSPYANRTFPDRKSVV